MRLLFFVFHRSVLRVSRGAADRLPCDASFCTTFLAVVTRLTFQFWWKYEI